MNMEERIKRINELYHKSKAEGLNEEEKAEQAKLRAEYVASVRANLRAQLDNVEVERPDGTVEMLTDIVKKKK
jgi:5-formyltetrahydrofolate cyclo-ligase